MRERGNEREAARSLATLDDDENDVMLQRTLVSAARSARVYSSSGAPTTRLLAHAKESSPIIQKRPKPAVAPHPARPVSTRVGGRRRTGTAPYIALGTNISAISRIVAATAVSARRGEARGRTRREGRRGKSEAGPFGRRNIAARGWIPKRTNERHGRTARAGVDDRTRARGFDARAGFGGGGRGATYP